MRKYHYQSCFLDRYISIFLVQIALGLLLFSGCSGGQSKDHTNRGNMKGSNGLVADTSQSSTLSQGKDVLIGNSVTDEVCRLVDFGARSTEILVREFEIRCAGWEEPSGNAWLFEASAEVPLETLLSSEELPIRDRNPESCTDLRRTFTFDNDSLFYQSCASVDGWPLMLVGRKIETDDNAKIVIGFGFLHLAPIFERWFAIVAGKIDPQTRQVGSETELARIAERELRPGGQLLKLDDIRLHKELVKLARVYNHAGDFSNAEETHRKSAAIQERFLPADDPALGVRMAAIALNLSDQSKFSEAGRLFSIAEKRVQSGTREQRARFLAYRGQHMSHIDEAEEGVRMIQASRVLLRDLAGDDSPDVAYSHFLEGSILSKRIDQHRQAVKSLETALSIFERLRDPVWIAFTRERLGEAHHRLGNNQLAYTYYVAAQTPMLAAFGEKFRYAELLAKLAVTENSIDRTEEAINTFKQSIDIAQSDSVASKYLEIDDVTPYLDLLMGGDNGGLSDSAELSELALEAIQTPRDQITGTAIRLMAARVTTSDPHVQDIAKNLQDAIDRRQSLRIEIAREHFRTKEERKPELIQELETEEAIISAAAERYEAELQATSPRYGQLVAPKPVDSARLSSLLTPGEAVLRVMPTDRAIYVLLIGHDGRIRGHKALISHTELSDKISRLRESLDLESVSFLKPYDRNLAHTLYQSIFGPIDAELTEVEHLIYVPSGPLLSLPPAVFVRTPPVSESTDWMIRHFAISVIPTISALEQLRTVAGSSSASQPFLGVGDPIFQGESRLAAIGDECLEDNDPASSQHETLVALPETRDELRQIASSLGSTNEHLLFGQAATEQVLQGRSDLADFKVVAFATHALLPHQLDCLREPALVLTLPSQANEFDDGLLTSSDIVGLRLDADWVLLSACNTGGPDGRLGGDSLSGLARAFFYAGARTLMVSHWTIASEATVSLTTKTFEAFGKGSVGKAEALRQAQLKMIDTRSETGAPDQSNSSHPAFWAPFTLVGDGGANRGIGNSLL